jgi:hypothetical protein
MTIFWIILEMGSLLYFKEWALKLISTIKTLKV